MLGIRKYFGGRYPLLNFFTSKIFFAVIKYRRKSLYNRNNKKQKLGVVLHNSDSLSKAVERYLANGFTKLNVGGGNKNLHGFLNIDFCAHGEVENELIANINDLSFLPSGRISHIHTNHVVEHFTEDQLKAMLQDFSRILMRDGLLTIRCPNALGVSYGFFFGMQAEDEKEKFLELGYPKDEEFYNPQDGWYVKDLYAFMHWIYGDVGNIVNQHLVVLTPTKIKTLLSNAGFRILKITDPETSNIVLVAEKY